MALESDFEKFYDKQNAAAGTRVRKGMQELKTMAQTIRAEIQGMKNGGGGSNGGSSAGGASKGGATKKAGGAAKAAPAKKAAAKGK